MKNILSSIKQYTEGRRDAGYSPLEVLGTLALIAILIGFLIVRFLGWRASANDRDAQATARAAVLVAEGNFSDDLSYVLANISADAEVTVGADHAAVEAAPAQVVGLVGGGDQVLVYTESETGTNWGVLLSDSASAVYCNLGDIAAAPAIADCTGAATSFQGL